MKARLIAGFFVVKCANLSFRHSTGTAFPIRLKSAQGIDFHCDSRVEFVIPEWI
jgi:hypothetical protein